MAVPFSGWHKLKDGDWLGKEYGIELDELDRPDVQQKWFFFCKGRNGKWG